MRKSKFSGNGTQTAIIGSAIAFMVIVLAVIAATALNAQEIAPDGSWVSGDPQIAPDGSWVGGKPKLAPDGTWVGDPC